ncbi:MAG: carboxypeptidase M32, partial [Planctomycetia bacterium]|nr:carboxypeptidase M32 [Planctomycetia bacterium]
MLATVESLVHWDEQTMLPPRAGGFRADQAEAMAAVVHARRIDPAQGERLARLVESDLATAGSAPVRATIRLLHEDFVKQSRLPGRLVAALARTAIEAQQAWTRALAASDWKLLEPQLTQMFALKREQATCQRPELDPYDGLMDDYEPGGRWPAVQRQFDQLRAAIVPLVQACSEAAVKPSDTVLRGHFPLAAQRQFVHLVAERIGFDFERGRIDTTVHPFCSTLGPHDCRLTTRWDERFLPTAFYSVLHEAGHGLYEQGLPVGWFGLPPGEAASLGIHESQSRLWENLVGRSAEFWHWCFPLARDAFPDTLSGATPADLAAAVRTVQPSFIRVEADEVTYNLHVMLRFDLERAVIAGDL